jgi:hypothetical protein
LFIDKALRQWRGGTSSVAETAGWDEEEVQEVVVVVVVKVVVQPVRGSPPGA